MQMNQSNQIKARGVEASQEEVFGNIVEAELEWKGGIELLEDCSYLNERYEEGASEEVTTIKATGREDGFLTE